jgi:hypothetical protein
MKDDLVFASRNGLYYLKDLVKAGIKESPT